VPGDKCIKPGSVLLNLASESPTDSPISKAKWQRNHGFMKTHAQSVLRLPADRIWNMNYCKNPDTNKFDQRQHPLDVIKDFCEHFNDIEGEALIYICGHSLPDGGVGFSLADGNRVYLTPSDVEDFCNTYHRYFRVFVQSCYAGKWAEQTSFHACTSCRGDQTSAGGAEGSDWTRQFFGADEWRAYKDLKNCEDPTHPQTNYHWGFGHKHPLKGRWKDSVRCFEISEPYHNGILQISVLWSTARSLDELSFKKFKVRKDEVEFTLAFPPNEGNPQGEAHWVLKCSTASSIQAYVRCPDERWFTMESA